MVRKQNEKKKKKRMLVMRMLVNMLDMEEMLWTDNYQNALYLQEAQVWGA